MIFSENPFAGLKFQSSGLGGQDGAGVQKLELNYHFNAREIKTLARLFRDHQEQIPEALEDFADEIERTIYSSMSITEAENFYA